MKNMNTMALKLFNSVLSTPSKADPVFLSEYGVFISSDAAYAEKEIQGHLKELTLSGQELNKTFYKSWLKVRNTNRTSLFVDQIFHYMSTYGTDHTGEVYIPFAELDIPDLKLKISVISGMTESELISKCLDILCSGIALKEDTLDEIFNLLGELKYKFTGDEGIRNKEANILIADLFKIYPTSPEEFLRYVLFKATGSTSMVKSSDTLVLIKASELDVYEMFNCYGICNIAPIFNRFKPLFLALKNTNKHNISIINKISKLSKKSHAPMPQNPLNSVTSFKLTTNDTHWLDNATVYALFKALSACYSRMNGQDSFVYRVRNGKSWVDEKSVKTITCEFNYNLILKYLKSRIIGGGRNVLIPSFISYALPTSEKLFIGNIPTGTKFFGDKIAAGVYWEDSWGASDLDVSGLNLEGKVGWNSDYHDESNGLTYSGDLTSAYNGAVEYLHVSSGISDSTTIVMNNVYDGDEKAGYKIIVGEGDDIDRQYMMNPNKVMAEVKTASVQKSTILGLIMREDCGMNSFTILNFGAGQAHISGNSDISRLATKALYQQWKKPLSLNTLLVELDYNVLTEKDGLNQELSVDFNLEVGKLNKSTFIDLFK
jgi:hypothetical protein